MKRDSPSAKSTSTFNMVLIQVTFKSLKQALRKRSKVIKSADGNLCYVGGGRYSYIYLPLASLSLLQRDLRLALWFRNDLWSKILING